MEIREYRDLVHKYTESFNPTDAIEAIHAWLDEYANGARMKKAVIGISGGKDSTVVAKVLTDHLGKENVFGLLMPNGEQKDISDSIRVVELLGIYCDIINIKPAYDSMIDILKNEISDEAKINIAPRIRMTTLYTYGQTHGYRVAGTGNLSERTLGYFTKWGDGASDFNILANFTSLEVMRIGEELGLPLDLVYKTPADGLSGKSDEDRLGVSYIDVHNYIRFRPTFVEEEVINKIEKMKNTSEHKRKEIPSIDYRYCRVKLPELGRKVKLKLDLSRHAGYKEYEEAFLTKTSFYPEGITFESIETYKDIRVDEVISWKYIY